MDKIHPVDMRACGDEASSRHDPRSRTLAPNPGLQADDNVAAGLPKTEALMYSNGPTPLKSDTQIRKVEISVKTSHTCEFHIAFDR